MKFSSRKFSRLRKIGLINSLKLFRRRKNKHIAMTKPLIEYVDNLSASTFDGSLIALWKETESLPMSNMQIDLTEAAFLRFLIQVSGSKNILEAGTFRGWSTAVMASAIEGEGKVVTMQIRPEEAALASELWQKHLPSNILKKIDQRIGNAAILMKDMAETFDLIFIDADKAGYPNYFAYAQKLIRKGGLIIFDNALNAGLVATKAKDRVTTVLRELNNTAFSKETMAEGFSPLIIPAWDGVVILRKN
jgi:O-methyltransferase